MPLNTTLSPELLKTLVDREVQQPTPSQAPPSDKWPMLAALLGGAADVATTQYNLSRPGGREQNPLLPQGQLANGLALGGSYIANALLSKYLNDHGHPTMAKILGFGGGLDGGISAIHNIAHANEK